MDPLKALARPAVVDVLRAIEDKLYETGLLVTVTGDSEADVTLAFRGIDTDGGAVVALVVLVVTRQPLEAGGVDWTPVRHYVLGKIVELADSLPAALRERVFDCPGPVVFLNGTAVA